MYYQTCGSSQDVEAPFIVILPSYSPEPLGIIQQTNIEGLNGRKKKESQLGTTGLEKEHKGELSEFLLASYISARGSRGDCNTDIPKGTDKEAYPLSQMTRKKAQQKYFL